MARTPSSNLDKRKTGNAANLTNAGKGRPKGVPNKTTTAVKQALIEAFEQMGGVPRLAQFAEEEPGEFYKLWIKILPQEISGPNGGAIPIQSVARVIIDPNKPE